MTKGLTATHPTSTTESLEEIVTNFESGTPPMDDYSNLEDSEIVDMLNRSLSQQSQSPLAEDDDLVPQQEWHARYREFASWDVTPYQECPDCPKGCQQL
ncbi:hypothetical protein DFH28DRAFT_1125791 [Melampsora americana]|nr:hypothetical protein DFH28DRAFT_1125791 [Melampsora americana]